jgi:3-methyladenine DNA glycosylase AlkD
MAGMLEELTFRPEIFQGLTDLMLEACGATVGDQQRWFQTAIGWMLRELSRRKPECVERFIDDHPELCTEAARNASKYLPAG